jgi:hypothetical protein
MATYYWVGGTGTWNNSSTTNWSLLSGGIGGAGPPLSTDIVNFDTNSGTGTCTTAAGSACATATLNSATLGLTLGAAHTMSGTFTLTQGTLSLGSFKLTCNIFSSSNANTRSIAFGTGDITLTGNATTIFTTATATNFSVSGAPVINATYSGSTGTRTVSLGNMGEANAISVNVTAGTDIVTLATTTGSYKNVNFTGFSGSLTFGNSLNIFGNLTISTGMTLNAATSTVTFAATSGTQNITSNNKAFDNPFQLNTVGATVKLIDNLTTGSTRTITFTAGTLDLTNNTLSTGLFSSSNSNIRAILFGTGNITVTGNSATVWTTSTSTNFSFTGTPTVNATYSGSTGTRTITTSNSTTDANAINFNISAGTDTVALAQRYGTLNFTGFSGTLTNTARFIYRNLIISSGMTCTAGANATTFAGTSVTQQITTNNKTLDFPLSFNGAGSTFAFQDALTQGSTQAFTITEGTVQLKSGVTSTVGSFVANTANTKTLSSTTAGTQATISQASGTVNVSDLTIKDSNATGGASWNAYVDYENIDAGNNDGWNFSLSPPYEGFEPPITLRSFTQPRRF